MKTYYVNWQEYRAYSAVVKVKDDEDEDEIIRKIKSSAIDAEIDDHGFQGYVEDSFNTEEMADAD